MDKKVFNDNMQLLYNKIHTRQTLIPHHTSIMKVACYLSLALTFTKITAVTCVSARSVSIVGSISAFPAFTRPGPGPPWLYTKPCSSQAFC